MGYLLFVVIVSVAGIIVVVRRTHRPNTTEAGIEEFTRTLRAASRSSGAPVRRIRRRG